jgi:hypothetical protein
MVDVPVFPPDVAEITAEPPPVPVTRPVELTVATAGADDDQAKVAPGITAFFFPNAVAVSWSVLPTSIEALDGETVTRCVPDDPPPFAADASSMVLSMPGVTASRHAPASRTTAAARRCRELRFTINLRVGGARGLQV